MTDFYLRLLDYFTGKEIAKPNIQNIFLTTASICCNPLALNIGRQFLNPWISSPRTPQSTLYFPSRPTHPALAPPLSRGRILPFPCVTSLGCGQREDAWDSRFLFLSLNPETKVESHRKVRAFRTDVCVFPPLYLCFLKQTLLRLGCCSGGDLGCWERIYINICKGIDRSVPAASMAADKGGGEDKRAVL